MKKVRRRYITLIEIMIVMFLIALITGVLAYNYRASLDEGRAFKTKTGIERVRTILLLTVAQDDEAWDDLESNWKSYVKVSPLAHNPESLVKDGWGSEYKVTVLETREGERDIEVRSERFENYKRSHATLFRD